MTMDNQAYLFEERAEEIQDLLAKEPSWFMRWTITVVLIVVSMLLLGSWLIHYPEIVKAPFTLTAVNAPKSVVSHTNGTLVKLLVREQDTVLAGSALAYMESTARHEDVLKLSSELAEAWTFTLEGRLEALSSLQLTKHQQMGELQSSYQAFVQDYVQMQSYIDKGFISKKRDLIQREAADLISMQRNIEKQRDLLASDGKLARDEYKLQQKLAQEKVIASLDLTKEKSKYISRQIPYQQAISSLINNQYLQRSKQRELLELDKSISEQRSLFLQSLNNLQSAIAAWQMKFILKSPVSGIVLFATPLQPNQQVTSEQELLYVAPERKRFEGEINISQNNSGKIAVGQRVLIKFDGYPYQEYGIVYGRVKSISNIPVKDGSFFARIELPDGLMSNYHKNLASKVGMRASAEVITNDKRLFERIFQQLKGIVVGS